MPSATTTAATRRRRANVPVEPSTPEQLAASILVLIAGIERHDVNAPATIAFRSALARRGRELFEAGGPVVVSDMLARIRAADPERADARQAIVVKAWAGLLHDQDKA